MASSEFPVYKRLDFDVVSADGVHVRTSDGRELIDFYGGHAVAALGYGDAGWLDALTNQARCVSFQTNLVDMEIRRRAHDALARVAPDGIDRVFLVNSGAEANENALRLAFRHTGRTKVVAVEGGFHGRTAAAGACTFGNEKWYAFPRAPFDVQWVARDDVAALNRAVDERTAAVILEPVQGIAGAVALDHDFLRAARTRTREAGALFIADEVQCGMGRAGAMFAIEHAGVTPDVITTAKGLGAGFPVGAVLSTAALADVLTPGALGTTFGGGPMACAVVEEVVARLAAPGFLDRVLALEATVRERCRVGPVREISGRGLLLGLRCDRPAAEVLPRLRDAGILAGGASDPNVVRLMPPLTLRDDHVEALREALVAIGSDSGQDGVTS